VVLKNPLDTSITIGNLHVELKEIGPNSHIGPGDIEAENWPEVTLDAKETRTVGI